MGVVLPPASTVNAVGPAAPQFSRRTDMPEFETMREHFDDMTWPADKTMLMEHARSKDMDDETMHFLEELPDDRTFESWDDLPMTDKQEALTTEEAA
jgi:hypothetical protein